MTRYVTEERKRTVFDFYIQILQARSSNQLQIFAAAFAHFSTPSDRHADLHLQVLARLKITALQKHYHLLALCIHRSSKQIYHRDQIEKTAVVRNAK